MFEPMNLLLKFQHLKALSRNSWVFAKRGFNGLICFYINFILGFHPRRSRLGKFKGGFERVSQIKDVLGDLYLKRFINTNCMMKVRRISTSFAVRPALYVRDAPVDCSKGNKWSILQIIGFRINKVTSMYCGFQRSKWKINVIFESRDIGSW